jgi:hypothetical protein
MDRVIAKTEGRARLRRSATAALLPVATAVLAAGIFVADAITAEKLAVSMCYVVVVLLATRFASARGIVLVGAGCVGLTVLAFLVPGVSQLPAPGVKASISAAITIQRSPGSDIARSLARRGARCDGLTAAA